MGIWYNHFFLVKDLKWRPTKRRAEEVHQALERWGLISGKPELSEITVDEARRPGHPGQRAWPSKRAKVSGKHVEATGEIPPELIMSYGPVEGPAVGNVLGQADYGGSGPFEPALWGLDVVLGNDLKLLNADDYGMVSAVLEDPNSCWQIDWPQGFQALRPEGNGTPKTRVGVRHPLSGKPLKTPRGFSGLFRSALIFECGKAHPQFLAGSNPIQGVPERAFVKDLERAFGSKLLEIGVFG